MDQEKDSHFRIYLPIGVKLAVIIAVLLLVSLGAITALVSYMVSGDVRITAEDNNFNINKKVSSEAETVLGTKRSGTLALLDTLDTLRALSAGTQAVRRTIEGFFERNGDIAFVGLISAGSSPGAVFSQSLVNEPFFRINEIRSSPAAAFIAAHEEVVERSRMGAVVLLNASLAFDRQILVMLCPWQADDVVAIFFSPDTLVDIFGVGTNVSYMINDEGDVLVHADAELVRTAANMAAHPFIRTVWESPQRSLQIFFTETDEVRYFGAFQKLDIAGAAVITRIDYSIVFDGISATTRRNILLTGAVLSLSIMLVWLYSKTLSRPMRLLAKAATRIEEGDFEIELKVNSRDEVGLLARSFEAMSKGLAERERLRVSFGKFINEQIAERAMQEDLALGGESKMATIIFSDMRNFTKIVEKMRPNDVLGFINSYMTQMVACVEKAGGVVDKFIGDAVMAVWGVPFSTGTPADDALNCIKSALLMRETLIEMNKTRGTDKRPIIKIGCGINSGEVFAGLIGSSRKMEYTVIGDPVNTASRTEELCKTFATDILITDDTRKLVAASILTEEMPSVMVKGKEEPIRIFAVINLKAPKGEKQPAPATLSAVRRLLDIPAPDLSKVDINAEEQKFKVMG